MRCRVKHLMSHDLVGGKSTHSWLVWEDGTDVGDLRAMSIAINEALTCADAAEAKLEDLREMVAKQAEDDGLWFVAVTAPEEYLQQELRKLHAALEETKPGGAPSSPTFGEISDECRRWEKRTERLRLCIARVARHCSDGWARSELRQVLEATK